MGKGRTWRLVSNILTVEFGEGTSRIGRESKSNDIVIAGFGISKNHAEASVAEEAFLLKDLGSSNGTYVNGERIAQQLVRHGDRVTLGDQNFTAKVGDEEPES